MNIAVSLKQNNPPFSTYQLFTAKDSHFFKIFPLCLPEIPSTKWSELKSPESMKYAVIGIRQMERA